MRIRGYRLEGRGATDVDAAPLSAADRDAGQDFGDRLHGATGRQKINGFRLDLLGNLGALHVHDWRGAGDGDGLFESADLELGIDLCRETSGQLDAFALEGRES